MPQRARVIGNGCSDEEFAKCVFNLNYNLFHLPSYTYIRYNNLVVKCIIAEEGQTPSKTQSD